MAVHKSLHSCLFPGACVYLCARLSAFMSVPFLALYSPRLVYFQLMYHTARGAFASFNQTVATVVTLVGTQKRACCLWSVGNRFGYQQTYYGTVDAKWFLSVPTELSSVRLLMLSAFLLSYPCCLACSPLAVVMPPLRRPARPSTMCIGFVLLYVSFICRSSCRYRFIA